MEIKRWSSDIIFNGEVVGMLAFSRISLVPTHVEVHNEIYYWSPSIYRQALLAWEKIKEALKENGITKIIATSFDPNDTKKAKYWVMFGFPPPVIQEHNGAKILYTELDLTEESAWNLSQSSD